MNLRRLLPLMVLSAVSTVVLPVYADDTAAILEKMRANATDHERVAFDLNMEFDFGMGPAGGTGSMGFAGEKRFNTMKMSMGQMAQGMEMTMHTVMDEDTMLTWNSMLNIIQKIDLKAVREQAPQMPLNAVDSPAAAISEWDPEVMDYIGEVDLNGEKTGHFVASDLTKLDVSALSPSEGMPMGQSTPSAVELWIGMEDGLPRKMELKGNDGKVVMRQTFTNFRYGSDVTDDLFELNAPAGAQTVDMTAQMIAIWNSGGASGFSGMGAPGGQ